MRITAAGASAEYRPFAATTPSAVARGLAQLERLVRHYGEQALRGDPKIFAILDEQRKVYKAAYALDMLTAQLRPEAAMAFRQKDYLAATTLYERFESRLTRSERKKLEFAKKRASSSATGGGDLGE